MKFIFRNYIKIIKKCLHDPNMANESVITILYEIFDEKGCVYVTPEDASHLMNGETNVPRKISRLLSINNRDIWKEKYDEFYSKYIDSSKTNSIVMMLTKMIKDDKSLLEDTKNSLINYSTNKKIFLFNSLLEVLKINNKILDKKTKIECWGKNEINLYYGDLFKLAFDKKYENKKKCIVIPVDTEFNLEVNDNNRYAVASDTIHGQWILKMLDRGVKKATIRKQINSKLKYMDDNFEKRKGEIIDYKYDNTTFLLFAFTTFIEGVATTNLDELKICLSKLIDYYNFECQGIDLYIPLIGTGRSGLCLNYDESFKLIKDVFIENKSRLRGKINITVYYKDADELEDVLENELL